MILNVSAYRFWLTRSATYRHGSVVGALCAIAKLPKDFPQAMAESIAAGAKRRLNSLATTEGGA